MKRKLFSRTIETPTVLKSIESIVTPESMSIDVFTDGTVTITTNCRVPRSELDQVIARCQTIDQPTRTN